MSLSLDWIEGALLSIFFLLGYVAYSDVSKRKIFNYSVVLVFLCEVYLLGWGRYPYFSPGWAAALAAFLVFFVLFFVFYRLGWMGAGDVKLGAVLAFLFGLQSFVWVWAGSIVVALLYAALVKVVGALGWEVARRQLTFHDVGKKYVPYGACLSMAAMLFILKSEAGL